MRNNNFYVKLYPLNKQLDKFPVKLVTFLSHFFHRCLNGADPIFFKIANIYSSLLYENI